DYAGAVVFGDLSADDPIGGTLSEGTLCGVRRVCREGATAAATVNSGGISGERKRKRRQVLQRAMAASPRVQCFNGCRCDLSRAGGPAFSQSPGGDQGSALKAWRLGRKSPPLQPVRVRPLRKLDYFLTLILLMLYGAGSIPATAQILGLGAKPAPVV